MQRLLSVWALAGVLLLALSTTAFAAAARPVRASHGDPFASCKAGGSSTSRNWRSAEVEPWIASNPANLSNLIGSWQQDRWSDGGAKGQVAAWSFDGGRSWGNTPQPFTICAQPYYKKGGVLPYERTSDPWQSIGPDGTAFAVSLPFDGDFVRNGLGVAVSHDGGRTWVDQQDIDPLLARSDTGDPADDKESVTADPNRAGWAYVVWDQLQDIFGPCPASTRQPVRTAHDTRTRVRRAAPNTSASCPVDFTGPAYFARTTDGGKTWVKNPVPMVPTGPGTQTIGNQIVIDRHSGVLYDFFNFIAPGAGGNAENNVEMVFSSDQGLTWSAPQYVQRLATTAELRVPVPARCNCGVVYPGDETKPLRTGDIIPEPAIDPNTGQLYVIWQDGRPNNFQNDMLLASTSTAGGLTGTWSAPTLVNPPDDKAAFTAGIAVNMKGQVGVTYYDLTPPLTRPDVLLTDTWFTATAGPGLAFGPRQLIGGPYNMEAAPVARGWFVGDYLGLTALIPAPGQDESDGQQGGESGGGDQSKGGHQQGGNDQGGDHQQGGNHQEGESAANFVALFIMTNCRDNSCRSNGSADGTERGSDPTDAFSSRVLRSTGR